MDPPTGEVHKSKIHIIKYVNQKIIKSIGEDY